MDSVGGCIRCGKRLCAEHALRGNRFVVITEALRRTGVGIPYQFYSEYWPSASALAPHLNELRPDLRPLFRYEKQIKAFNEAIGDNSGVICLDCRYKAGLEAARSANVSPKKVSLAAGGSERLREATTAYLRSKSVGDLQAELEDRRLEIPVQELLDDLVELAFEKLTPVNVPVEWEAVRYTRSPGDHYNPNSPKYFQGKVRRTRGMYPVLSIGVLERHYNGEDIVPYTWYITPDGKWFVDLNQSSLSPGASNSPPKTPQFKTTVMDEERGIFWKQRVVTGLIAVPSGRPQNASMDEICSRAAALLKYGE